MRVRLGLRFDPLAGAPGSSEEDARRFRELIDPIVAADRVGLEIAWLTERPDRSCAALHLAAALAARTTRVRVGVGPIALPLVHPLRLAEDAATVDGISGGRLELALGLGREPALLARFGIGRAQRRRRFEEGFELLRRAFADAPLEFSGRYFEVSAIEVVPKPVQRPTPPLWVAAEAEVAIRRVARLGSGFVARSSAAAQRFLAAWQAAGRDPADARIGLELPLVLAEDAAGLAGAGPVDPRRAAPIACSPAEASRRLCRALDPLGACGSLDVVLPAGWPGAPGLVSARAAERLVREVAPALAERFPTNPAA
ncbi:MAG: LLM class flavin-dependent oxidoreductase [Deltaproteobacteria bacterium]|nr:MAG: LLM class flavin-dependent oxidoreductase [Deltaproteobacteria bacterium]